MVPIMANSNVLNWFKQPALTDNDNVFNVGGTTAFTKDAIIQVEGDPALGESDYEARWAEFLRVGLGGGQKIITTSDAEYTVTKNDGMIIADTSSNVVNANLPPAADFFDAVNDVGYAVTLKKLDSSGNDAIFVADGVELVEGLAELPISSEGDTRTVISNGIGWFIK